MSEMHPPPELTMTAWLRFGAIRHCVDLVRPQRVLEVGAGQGGLGSWLANRCEYTGFEPDDASRAVAEQRLATLGRGRMLADLADTEPPYDLLCAFEVLEHIEDDRKALAEWRALLAPGGAVLLSVPAHAARFNTTDEYVGHFRRYDDAHLRDRLVGEGFDIVRWRSYGAGLGNVLDGARNAMLRRRPASDTVEARTAASGRLYQPNGRAISLVNWAGTLPFRALQTPFGPTDIGIGYVVLARLRP